MLVAMLLHVLLLSGPQQARADSEAPMVWPRPASLSHGACNGGSPLGLAGAQLQVRVLSGQADEATAYVEAALQAALPEWGCGIEAGPAATGPTISVVIANASCTQPSCYSHENDESYSLQIDEAGAITIAAAEIFGANWALSTLSSLANGTCGLTCLPIEVEDTPRFGHRGVLVDTARHWFSVEDLKRKILDPMHATKMNVLHWHVYDSQSQPLELRFDPRLWLPYSKEQRFTQEDAREVVRYAFARGIRVLPEFDLPGHTAIFGKADPGLVDCLDYLPWDGTGVPNVMANQPPAGQLKPDQAGLASQLLDEMMELFPNSIISSGADEVNFNCWNNATVVAQNASDYPQFQEKMVRKLAGFQEQVAATINGAGRTMAVWDESYGTWNFSGTPALPRGSVLLSWLDTNNTAAMTDAGYNVVWMPWRRLYLDCGLGTPTSPPNWCAPLNNWTTIYLANPLETFNATSGDPSRLLGAEVATWSEHIVPSILDYVVWPRAAALAERLWSPEKDTQWCDTAPPQLNSEGVDYCAPAKTYKGVDLTFDNLVDPKEV
ncbi:hypothetical protein CHLNCDRAFT_141982 [Chlorella variabilis]|uniref:beta-N-acetylhexosaminidase n=1 Tax=Chlorella variabilis TaxID=554065 RepID=E1Z7G7_CHLVA|nr:hypothetical protein CHLNCDRAFT_141982 [Chlorella variabilis]EFN57917.1 hypothetical protein CHLNCDRAFT_141982 [Chlorella variabilis]|eukprot:XP_005850019.1 hypothetical protein CHLNCDRAFT_141982 [Chlorella variabilis]